MYSIINLSNSKKIVKQSYCPNIVHDAQPFSAPTEVVQNLKVICVIYQGPPYSGKYLIE